MQHVTFGQACLVQALALTLGCSTSGQTGSPGDDESPDYTSPTRFTPGGEGSPTGDNGGPGTGFPFRLPPLENRGLTALVGETLVVAAAPEEFRGGQSPTPRERGLLIYDVSSGAEPDLVGELFIAGLPLKLYLEPEAATLIIDQHNETEYSELPEQVDARVTRVLRIDTSDLSAPSIVGQVDVPGRYMQSYLFDGRLVVATDLQAPVIFECAEQSSGTLLPTVDVFVPPRQNFGLTALEWTGTEFAITDSVQLEGLHQLEDGADGRIAIEAFASVSETSVSSNLLVAQLSGSDGTLSLTEPVALGGQIQTAKLQGESLNLAVETESGTEYQRYQLAAVPTLLGARALPGPASAMVLLSDTLLAVTPDLDVETEPTQADGFLIDASDPASIGLVSLPGSATLAAFGELLVGAGASAANRLNVQLWDISNPAAPALTASVETPWPYNFGIAEGPEGRTWSLQLEADAATGRLLYPHGFLDAPSGEFFSRLGIAELGSTSVEPLAVVADSVFSTAPAASATTAYSSGSDGLSAVPLSDPAASVTLAIYPARSSEVLAELELAGYRARLERSSTAAVVVLDPLAGGATTTLELEHYAEALVPMGNRLVALGLERPADCDFLVDEGLAEADLICPTPNQAGLTVIDLAAEPTIALSLPLPTDFQAPEVPEDASVRTTFSGYRVLDAERLALPASRFTRCDSPAACDSLGIQGEEGMASPGCNPQTQDCSLLPTVITFFSGGRQEQLVYTLDVTRGALGGPTLLQALVDLLGEGQPELVNDTLQSGNALAFRRLESVQDANGEALTDPAGGEVVRHFIELARQNEQGVLEFEASINVPGRALLLSDDGSTLYSVEPRPESAEIIDAVLHRSRLESGGAFVEETLDLGPGYRDAVSVDGQLLLLFGEPVCTTESPMSRVYGVRLSEPGNSTPMALSAPLELAGEGYGFAIFDRPWPEGLVQLRGGPAVTSGRLELSLGAPGETPAVNRYFIQPPF